MQTQYILLVLLRSSFISLNILTIPDFNEFEKPSDLLEILISFGRDDMQMDMPYTTWTKN